MGKCHGITFVRWIVKHLVSYMAAAQQDNRLISWLSEPYRTISHFLTLIPFSPDIRLRLIHTFTVHSVNTYPVDTHRKKAPFLLSFLSFLNRENQEQPTNSRQFQLQLQHSPSLPERTQQQLTLQTIPLKGQHVLFMWSCADNYVHTFKINPLWWTLPELTFYLNLLKLKYSILFYRYTRFFCFFYIYIFYPATIMNSVAATHSLKLGHFCHC